MGMFQKGTRTIDNLFTGAELTKAGHGAALTLGAATIGKEVVDNTLGINQSQQAKPEVVGTKAPTRLSYDGRQNNMGADGDLALALSKLK